MRDESATLRPGRGDLFGDAMSGPACPHCAASATGRCLACVLGNSRLRDLADRDPAYAALVRGELPVKSDPPGFGSQAAGESFSSESGARLWADLHRRALAYSGDATAERAWIHGFAAQVPCGECRGHWFALIAERPPDLADAATYFAWTVAVHNRVNVRLGKPMVAEGEARRLWSEPITA